MSEPLDLEELANIRERLNRPTTLQKTVFRIIAEADIAKLLAEVDRLRAALHGSEAGPQQLKHEDIELVEPYLHHLREAAEGWAFEDVDIEQETARRAVIVMSRNVLCLVDELRKRRDEAGPQETREEHPPADYAAMISWLQQVEDGQIAPQRSIRDVDWRTTCGVLWRMLQAGAEAGVSARVLELAKGMARLNHSTTGHSPDKKWHPFDTCEHPDCLLVRAALGVSPAAPEKELK